MIHPALGVFSSFQPITPSDTATFSCDAIFVGGAGAVIISASNSATPVTFSAVAGQVLPIQLRNGRVLATGTVATGLVALQ